MAGVDYDDFDGYDPSAPAAGGGRLPRLINMAGAASSVLLVIGLGVWGYRLAVRDVHGVPVIRAVEGPMRIAPEDPGGTVAAHQGLAVNAIAEAGGVTPPSETLTLAPRAVELTEGDGAGLSDLPPMTTPAAATVAALEAPPAEALSGSAGMASVEEADMASPAETLATEVPEPAASEEISPDQQAQPEAVADLPAGALVRSLRPAARPANRPARAQASATAAAAPAAAAATPAQAAPAETSADKVSNGTRLVQLGAFDTADQARGEWKRLQGKFPELLGQKSLVVQPAESGGRTFYRLRALGFDGEADARRFCTALLAEGAACIPVTQR